jgi:hypothetical protein
VTPLPPPPLLRPSPSLCRLKQEVEALDQQSRAASKFSVRDHRQQQRRGGQELQDEDSSCGSSSAMNHLDETSTMSPSEDNEPQHRQQRSRALSFPSDSSLAAMTPSREELSETSSFIEPLQESPLHSAVGREAYRISSRYPSSSLAHLTSNTRTTLLADHERQHKAAAASSSRAVGVGVGPTGGAEATGAHSLFDIMTMDFASSEPPSPSS